MASSTELHFLTIAEAARLVKSKKLSPVDLTRAALDRIDALDRRLKAFVTLLDGPAERSAKAAARNIARGNYLGPLHGIPVAIKDLYDTKGVKTTSCSKVRANYVPTEDATVVRKLKEAGAIILGKVTTHEFAFGFDAPPTRNPWNVKHTPSGSSGGSACALAAGMCYGATGSDTGGSIRAPASVNGVAGLKPTYGRVSKAGVAVLSWSLDHTGPLARSVEDLALILNVIAGPDALDPTTKDVRVPNYLRMLTGDIRGLRIGVPKNYFFTDVQKPVARAVRKAIRTLEGLGGIVSAVRISHLEHMLPSFFSIVIPEAAVYHQKAFRKHPAKYGPDVRALLETGQVYLASTYITAQRNRFAFKAAFREAFEKVDVLVMPSMPVTAPKIGQETYRFGDREEPIFTSSARFCCPFNLAGLPAVSVPCGFSPDGLPIGLQIVGKPFDEGTVLRVAHAYEKNTEWHKMRPPL